MLSRNKLILLLVIAGLILRFIFVFLHPFPDSGNDAYQYGLIATNILNGNGISTDINPPYSPQIDRVPFYPIFMSFFYFVFGHHLIVIRIVQAILSILTAIFMFFISKEIIDEDSKLLALPIMSFVLTLLCPFLVFFVSILFTETLTAFLISLSILLFVYAIKLKSRLFYFYSGVIIGLAFMTRPEVFAFPVVLAGALLFKNLHNLRSVRINIAIYLLPFFLTWGIWIARNYSAFNRFVPITAQGGPMLLIGTYPPSRYEKNFPEEVKEEYLKVRFLPEKERLNVASDMRRRAFQRILNRPFQYMAYCFQRIPILWVNSYTTYIGIDDTFTDLFRDINKSIKERSPFFKEACFLLLKVVLYFINISYVLLGAVGMILLIRKWPTAYPLYITISYFTIIHLPLGDASPRYAIKILPIFLIFSSAGILYVYYQIKTIFNNIKMKGYEPQR